MVGHYQKKKNTELTSLSCPKKRPRHWWDVELESGIWEHCDAKMLSLWPAARLGHFMLSSSICMLNRSCCVHTGTVMNECKTHTLELQLCKCWELLYTRLLDWGCVCVCVSEAATVCLLHHSESCFKLRQQSLQPSSTIPRTPHAAS